MSGDAKFPNIIIKSRVFIVLWICLNSPVAAAQNKQSSAAKNTAKLDRETEELHHDHVSLSLSRVIQTARQAKEWTQKELATVGIVRRRR